MDVSEVSQEYICVTSKLHYRPRVLSLATSFGWAEYLALGLVRLHERFPAIRDL